MKTDNAETFRSLDTALKDFYAQSGFGSEPGKRPLTVQVYTGCLLVPLPNIETRHIYLKYHDLHHLVTGYSVGRIGEGEVSAWELGTGSFFVNPVLGLMNFIALSTGLALEPGRMWKAFMCGCRSRNLYPTARRKAVDNGRWPDVESLRADLYAVRNPAIPIALRIPEFVLYGLTACIIHAAIAAPAVITRYVTDVTLGKTFLQALKPVKRTDLY